MKISASLLLFSAVTIVFSGCTKISPARQISGQVFIVTRDGQSVKLGLVEVRLYKAEDTKRAFKQWKDSVESDRKKIDELKSQANAVVQSAKIEQDSTERAERVYSRNALSNGTYDPTSDRALLDAELHAQENGFAAEEVQREVEDLERGLYSAEVAFRYLPRNAIAITKTDADGRFTITPPRSDHYVVIAAASRPALGESYFWAVDIGDRERIALSNDNVVSSDNPESVLRATLEPVALKTIENVTSDLQDGRASFEPPSSGLLDSKGIEMYTTKSIEVKTASGSLVIPKGATVTALRHESGPGTTYIHYQDFYGEAPSDDLTIFR